MTEHSGKCRGGLVANFGRLHVIMELAYGSTFTVSTAWEVLRGAKHLQLWYFQSQINKEKEAIREMYGQLAGSLRKFDAIMDHAIGQNADPFSFLVIRADARNPNRTFMLRFEAFLEPEDSDSE